MGIRDFFTRPFDLDGKSVIITGASSGIGAELARQMAAEGARLALAARRREALEEVADQCRRAGGEAIVVPTDVSDEAACERLVEETVGEFGRLDALVNNAGITMWTRFREIEDLSIFDKIMRVNYLGSVYCTHYALPYLEHTDGLLVAVSSLSGLTGVPTRSGYSASKHAMQGFFDSLRIELADTGVDVQVISPGFIATDIRDKALDGTGEAVGESPRDESTDTMSVEECVRQIMEAIHDRRRELVMTPKARIGMWIKMVLPAVTDKMAERAVREQNGE